MSNSTLDMRDDLLEAEFECTCCGTDLAQVDEHWNLECGAGRECSDCYAHHIKSCATCWDKWVDAVCDPSTAVDGEGDSAMLILPGMCSTVRKQNEAAAVQRGAELTCELLQPAGDITRTTGKLESHSPLFRGSAADPQFSLF